jgi:hypothetical protein
VAAADFRTPPLLGLAIDPATGRFNVSVGGSLWLR